LHILFCLSLHIALVGTTDVEAVKFLWKRKHFEEKSWKRKANLEAFDFLRSRKRKHFSQNMG